MRLGTVCSTKTGGAGTRTRFGEKRKTLVPTETNLTPRTCMSTLGFGTYFDVPAPPEALIRAVRGC